MTSVSVQSVPFVVGDATAVFIEDKRLITFVPITPKDKIDKFIELVEASKDDLAIMLYEFYGALELDSTRFKEDKELVNWPIYWQRLMVLDDLCNKAGIPPEYRRT